VLAWPQPAVQGRAIESVLVGREILTDSEELNLVTWFELGEAVPVPCFIVLSAPVCKCNVPFLVLGATVRAMREGVGENRVCLFLSLLRI
jgi:hypothetical protein